MKIIKESFYILTIVLLMANNTISQTNFVEQTSANLQGLFASAMDVGDVNGDGTLDFFISGSNNSSVIISKLYSNDGNAIFTEFVGTPFDSIYLGSAKFGDLDGDSDLDLIISGLNNQDLLVTKLYENNGSGAFIEVMGISIPGVYYSDIELVDIDSDSDLDIFISGMTVYNTLSSSISKIYENNGGFNFTETLNSIEPVFGGDADFADVNGDSNLDFILTGASGIGNGSVAILYLNSGAGVFTESPAILDPLSVSSAKFADIDNDFDQDLLTTGLSGMLTQPSNIVLYENNGSGALNSIQHSIEAFHDGHFEFEDIDNDGDVDILLSGYTAGSNQNTQLYINNGGVFSKVQNTCIHQLQWSKIRFGDFDGDGDSDLIISGTSSSTGSITALYLNEPCSIDTSLINNQNSFTANNSNINYQWLDCDNNYAIISGETGQSFTPLTNGYYAVELTKNGCCIDTSNCVPFSNLGIHDNNFGDALTLYPNPTTGNFSINLGSVYKNTQISITDISGRLIDSKSITQSQIIPLSIEEPAGTYNITIVADDKKAVIQLIKE